MIFFNCTVPIFFIQGELPQKEHMTNMKQFGTRFIITRYFVHGSVIPSASENHPRQYNFHILSYFGVLDNKDDV